MIHDLGTLQISCGATEVFELGGKQASFVGLLLTAPARTVSDDRLVDVLWPTQPADLQRRSLQTLVWRLRRLLPADRLPANTTEAGVALVRRVGNGYALPARGAEVDSARFEDLGKHAGELLSSGRFADAVDVADEANSLWRGTFLGDLGNAEWARGRREQLDHLRLEVAETRWTALLAQGRSHTVVAETSAAVHADPLRERTWELLMRAQLSVGGTAAALHTFQRVRDILRDELGLEPGPGLQSQQARALAGGNDRIDEAGGRRVDRLPRVDPLFLGRETALQHLRSLFADPQLRLVTAIGPGGIGKTRLCVEFARLQQENSSTTVRFVDLSNISAAAPVDADGLTGLVGTALGLSSSEQDVAWLLADVLDRQPTLLLLDNCEHVSVACAGFVERLLADTHATRVLATSRSALGVLGEHLLEVPPLSDAPARELLTQRVARSGGTALPVHSDDPAVAAIIAAVSNFPLGIELAASRSRAMTLSDIAGSLGAGADVISRGVGPRRHRTMSSAVEWSYRLLSPTAQQVFRRLGVFISPFTVTDATAVGGGGGVRPTEVEQVLLELVDRSMVVSERGLTDLRIGGDQGPAAPDRSWFRMLEPLRQYAQAAAQACAPDAVLVNDNLRAHVRDWISRCPPFVTADRDRWHDSTEVLWPTIRDHLPSLMAEPFGGAQLGLRVGLHSIMRRRVTEAIDLLQAGEELIQEGTSTANDHRAVLAAVRLSLEVVRQPRGGTDGGPKSLLALQIVAEQADNGAFPEAVDELLVPLAFCAWRVASPTDVAVILEFSARRLEQRQDDQRLVTVQALQSLNDLSAQDPSVTQAVAGRVAVEYDACTSAGSEVGAFFASLAQHLLQVFESATTNVPLSDLAGFQRQLRHYLAYGCRELIDQVEALACDLALLGDDVGAAEAFGAAERERELSGTPLAGRVMLSDRIEQLTRDRLGEESFHQAFRLGWHQGDALLDRITPAGLAPRPA